MSVYSDLVFCRAVSLNAIVAPCSHEGVENNVACTGWESRLCARGDQKQKLPLSTGENKSVVIDLYGESRTSVPSETDIPRSRLN